MSHGRRCIPVSRLLRIAAPSEHGPAPTLERQIERIQRLPNAQRRFVMPMINTVLAQASG